MQVDHSCKTCNGRYAPWLSGAKLALLLASLAWAVAAPRARGEDEPKRAEIVKTAVNVSALQQGKAAMAAVVVDIKPGYHAQSNTPSQPYLIKFSLKPEDNPSLKLGDPIYPKGQDYDTKGELGVLNVYEGRVVVRIPAEVKPDAAPGEAKIKGKVTCQVCDDKVCYRPVKLPFEIATSIVGAGEEVKPNEPEVFDTSTTHPTTAPAAAPAVPPAVAPAREADAHAAEFNSGSPQPILLAGLYRTEELRHAITEASEKRSGTVLAEVEHTVPVAFALAFLAGLVFNVMPCVLPVLPLKAMGFYEASQHNRARSLGLGAAFSLGVVASFAVLGLLVVVKQVFKWGEIFSNPWFLGGLVLVLLVMALHTFGLFAVRLPDAMYGFSPRHDTFFGNVLFGILTAALSTPCTFGMFVGLLAFALKQSTAVGMGLMITVGVGMAFPYFVLSAFPEAARRFPRTGPWAELVKQFLGFVLLGTAVYFAEPFVERVVRPQAFWWILFALVVASGIFVVAKTLQFSKTALGPSIAVLIALAMIVPAYAVAHRLTITRYHWQPYSPEALASARASKQIVLVEFTASWCTTCHTLEAFVLNDPKVAEAVTRYDVKMIRADLSDEDAPGWRLLRDYKRGEGVPLTAIYPPS